jgi:hypothetical protein
MAPAWYSAFQQFITQTNASVLALQKAQASVASQEAADAAQIVLINQALATANAAAAAASPSAAQEQTASGNVDLTTTGVWQAGPVVRFSAPRAATVTFGMSGPSTGGSTTGINQMTGNARLQQILSGAETTIATATFTVTPATRASGGEPAIPSSASISAWSPTSTTDTLTSAVSYRVDLERLTGCTSSGVSVVTDVKRT